MLLVMTNENIYAAPEAPLTDSSTAILSPTFKESRSLSKLVVNLVKANGALHILGAILSLLYLIQQKAFNTNISPLIDGAYAVWGICYVILFIVTVVFFSKWIHRSYTNAKQFQTYPMRHSAGWSVGSFFIPIIMLFHPYQAMKDIWIASCGPKESRLDHSLVRQWWAWWIISSFADQISNKASDTTSVEGLYTAQSLAIASYIISIILCYMAIKLVRTITEMQYTYVEQINTPSHDEVK